MEKKRKSRVRLFEFAMLETQETNTKLEETASFLLASNDTAKALDWKAESNHTTDYLSYGTNCFHFKAD